MSKRQRERDNYRKVLLGEIARERRMQQRGGGGRRLTRIVGCPPEDLADELHQQEVPSLCQTQSLWGIEALQQSRQMETKDRQRDRDRQHRYPIEKTREQQGGEDER